MKTLDEIFNYFGTDKGSVHGDRHNYSPVYSALFTPLRHSEIKLLEIGILEGASLDSWHEFFTKATIHGAEVKPAPSLDRFEDMPRVKIHKGCATDPALIPENDFQIIIDDACHSLAAQVCLLSALWSKLKPGGYYILEDLFVGNLPWGVTASGPKNRAYLQYKGYAPSEDTEYMPKHPQDLNFLNRRGLPRAINKILEENSHFFTISSIGRAGGLHMMLVITKC